MDERITRAFRLHMAQHGLNAEIQQLVEAWRSPADDGDVARVNISVGYESAGKRRETAIHSVNGEDDALALAASRDGVATLLSLGVAAMPASARPAIPDWIRDDPGARRTRRGLARASVMADDEARGRRGAEPSQSHPDTPF